VAKGRIVLRRETVKRIMEEKVEKGDVLEVSRVAGIMAAKRTYEILPLCHQVPLTSVEVRFEMGEDWIDGECKVKTTYRTGVEMDALTCISTALLTIWDMVKKYEKDEEGQYPTTRISELKVVEKVKERLNQDI